MSEDCHDSKNGCSGCDPSGACGSTSEAGPGLPPFPAWLRFGICIGEDESERFPPPSMLAVGIYMGAPEDSANGTPWLVKSSKGRPWISLRCAWEPEIKKYDLEFGKRLGIPMDPDEYFPPYKDGVAPPFPIWMKDALITHVDKNATNQTVIRAVGINVNHDQLWVAVSIGGYPFHSERYASSVDRVDYDAAFLREMNTTTKGSKVTHVDG